MPKKFCIVCGREDVELIDRMCPSCYIKTKRLVVFPPVILGKICKICNAEWIDGKWVRLAETEYDAVRDVVLRYLAKEMIIDRNVKDYRIDMIKKWKERGGGSFAEIVVGGKVGNQAFRLKKKVELRLTYSICDDCLKRKSGYYEAIIQLRGKKEFSEEKRALFESFFTNETVHSISDVKISRDGIDYYFINKTAAKRLISTITSIVNAEITESYENETIKNGKREAKLVISVRI
jgi:nonsense-mediated mRNA decay protein 3